MFVCVVLAVAPLQAQDDKNLIYKPFSNYLIDNALHDYNQDGKVIMLENTSVSSEMVYVPTKRFVKLEVYVHYSRSNRFLGSLGRTALGLGIGSLPFVLPKQSIEQLQIDNTIGKTLLPLAGGILAAPGWTKKRLPHPISTTMFTRPQFNNGFFTPNASLRVSFYDSKRKLLHVREISIDRQANNLWQKLVVQESMEEEGYYRVELVNTSKTQVYFDAFYSLDFDLEHYEAMTQGINRGMTKPKGIVGNSSNFEVTFEHAQNTANKQAINARGQTRTWVCTWTCWDSSFSRGCSSATCVEVSRGSSSGVTPIAPVPNIPSAGPSGSGHISVFSSGSAAPARPPLSSEDPTRPIPKPAKRDFSKTMSTNPAQIIAHFLNALAYARENNIVFKYSDYFFNMPPAGDNGFGATIKLKGDITLYGHTFTVVLEVPLATNNQYFQPWRYNEKTVTDPNQIDFPGQSQVWYYGYNTYLHNTTKLQFYDQYYEHMHSFINRRPYRETGRGDRDPRPGGRN